MQGLHCSVLVFALVSEALGSSGSFAQAGANAKSDSPQAQYELAQKYETGKGVERDWVTAINLYEQAARKGHLQSMFRLGVLYYNGEVFGDTMKADNELAWLWFTLATAYGEAKAKGEAERIATELHPSVLSDLRMHAAETLLMGGEVPAKVEAGVELYRAAAEDGSLRAAEILGTLYMEGTLVPQDRVQAAKLYEKAAKDGSSLAIAQLAKFAESESPPNLVRAFGLYRKAALKGDARSMYRVGEMYAGGLGVERDLVLADAWYVAAGYFKLAEGTTAARKVELELSRSQVEKAQIEAHNLIVSVEP